MTTLTVQPLLPPAVWLTLLIVSGVMLVVYAARRPAAIRMSKWLLIVAMMAVSVALALLLLLNPQWVKPIPAPEGKPTLTILVDSSGSMATADVPARASRLKAAADEVNAVLPKLKEAFDVQLVSFSDTAKPVVETSALQANGSCTDLAASLHPYLQETRPQGQAIWLLSDGIPTSPGGMGELEQAVRTARTQDVPVYTSTFGSSRKAIDLMVDLRYPQDMAFVGQQTTITAQLHHVGLPFRQVNVGLYRGDVAIAQQTVTLPEFGMATVKFPVSEKSPGIWTYEVRAQLLPEETVISNNTALYVLKAVNKPNRVLVLEGKPYWDSKFFVQTLSSIPAFRVDSYVRLKEDRFIVRSGGSGSEPATAPADAVQTWRVLNDPRSILADPAQLGQYQILVLGREAEAFLTPEAIANIQRWVSREGGSLLCYRGAPEAIIDDRLQKLMPVTWSPVAETHFAPRLTDTGRQLQWFAWGNSSDQAPPELPLLAMRQKQQTTKPLAVVVASANTSQDETSAFVYQPYGAGRVVVIEGGGMWRWAFTPPQQRQKENPYESLWQGTMRWLISGGGLQPGQQRLLRADSTIFRPAETTAATMLVRAELASAVQPRIKLSKPDGSLIGRFSPQAFGDDVCVFRIEFGKLPEGGYRASIDDGTGGDPSSQIAFEVRDPGEEKLDLAARPDLMAHIARDSGGQVLKSGDGAAISDSFRGHQLAGRPAKLERTSAWDRGWILASAIGLWGVSWGLRRFWGLV